MAGISSKAAGGKENRRKFNEGTDLNTDLGLDWYETTWRGYDAQLGRFHQIDPLADANPSLSGYTYVMNNPLLFNDPCGLDTVRVNGEGSNKIQVRQGDILAWTTGDATSYYTYDPGNSNAVGGFVGEGMEGGTLPEVTVTASAKNTGSSPDFLPSLLGGEGYGGFSSSANYSSMGLNMYGIGQRFNNPAISAFKNNQFLATYKGKTRTWSMNFQGNGAVSGSQVNSMKFKFLQSKSITTFKGVEKFARNLNYLNSALLLSDIGVNGFNVGNSQSLVFNGIGYLGVPGAVIGTTYSILQMGLPTGNPAEMKRLGEGALQGQIMHPYQVMPGLGVSVPIR